MAWLADGDANPPLLVDWEELDNGEKSARQGRCEGWADYGLVLYPLPLVTSLQL